MFAPYNFNNSSPKGAIMLFAVRIEIKPSNDSHQMLYSRITAIQQDYSDVRIITFTLEADDEHSAERIVHNLYKNNTFSFKNNTQELNVNIVPVSELIAFRPS